jgi:DNA sulfur modification protein DndD
MKVDLLGWSSKGLRCPDLKFDFEAHGTSLPRITLIQMPNGTGKTTTLICLRAALTGEAAKWTPAQVREMAPPGTSFGTGHFEISLRVDGKHLTLSMRLDFGPGTVRYATTYDRGRVEKYNPPLFMHRFLTDHFVRLLIFDGELPGELLDNTKTRAQAALDAFFQLYLLDDAANAVQRTFDAAVANFTATHATGLTLRRNKLAEAQTKHKELTKAALGAKAALVAAQAEHDQLNREIENEIGATNEDIARRDGLVKSHATAIADRAAAASSLMNTLRRPHYTHSSFDEMLRQLRQHLDRLKLPESTSQQFFIELADEEECVCGRPIDVESRATILRKAGDYLGTDTYGALNHLKTQIQKLVIDLPQTISAATYAAVLGTTDHECARLETAIDALRQQIIQRGGDELQEKQARCLTLAGEIGDIGAALEELDRDVNSDDDDECSCIKYWALEVKRRENAVAEVTKTVRLRYCKDAFIEIASNAHVIARERLSGSIIKEMNEVIAEFLRSHNIRAASLGQSISLQAQGGASLGQTLAVGYAFLTTLFRKGGQEFPFVVDAPVTALDGRVRNQVARVIPRVCPQFVAFVLDTERADFTEVLETTSSDPVLYLTAFASNEQNRNLMGQLPDSGVSDYGNGLVVHGKEYFNSVVFSYGAAKNT